MQIRGLQKIELYKTRDVGSGNLTDSLLEAEMQKSKHEAVIKLRDGHYANDRIAGMHMGRYWSHRTRLQVCSCSEVRLVKLNCCLMRSRTRGVMDLPQANKPLSR
jgi:hypothetical protein